NPVVQRCRISLWYGRTNRLVEITSGTALWYRAGVAPVPIRWLLVRDPKGELDPQAFLATDLDARPPDILAWFVRRWQVEVTYEEVRAHCGAKRSANGRTWRSCAQRRPCSACSPSSRCSRTSSQNRASSRSEPPRGIQKPSRPSATPLPQYAAKYGRIKFLSGRGRGGTVSKFRGIFGSACRTPSHTPPKSAKVKLRNRSPGSSGSTCRKSVKTNAESWPQFKQLLEECAKAGSGLYVTF